MMTRPVVVGVDGSEESLQAVEWAAWEAERHAWPLRIVSAPAVLAGSILHAVLDHAHGPVAVVPPQPAPAGS
jgi:nucleotide-binding universal stress UspA family protein